uniref:Putative hydrolase n=1 Tax=Streptomyces sp. ML694-90F3 TaxID=1265536 RepID=A0A077KXV7_9ACTN|nr:Putative hydrolase [Streptomyces sp. ML694-90F3]
MTNHNDHHPQDGRPDIAAAVIVRARRLLLVLSASPVPGMSPWRLPAGKIKPGEDPLATAVREAKEETGLDATAIGTIGSRIHPDTGRLIHYVACTPADDTQIAHPSDPAIAAVCWLPEHQIPIFVRSGLYQPVRDHVADLCRSNRSAPRGAGR